MQPPVRYRSATSSTEFVYCPVLSFRVFAGSISIITNLDDSGIAKHKNPRYDYARDLNTYS